MITYIIKSGEYFKIGKTVNLAKRLKQYDTHNPDYQMVIGIDGDCEEYLHKLFELYHYKLEWFKLPLNWEEILEQSDYKMNITYPKSNEWKEIQRSKMIGLWMDKHKSINTTPH